MSFSAPSDPGDSPCTPRRDAARRRGDEAHGGQKASVRPVPHPTRGVPRMRAVTWHGRADVRVDTVPDPVLQDPTDVIVEITSSGICGSDLHLIEVMAPF